MVPHHTAVNSGLTKSVRAQEKLGDKYQRPNVDVDATITHLNIWPWRDLDLGPATFKT